MERLLFWSFRLLTLIGCLCPCLADDVPGLHNVHRYSETVLVGSEPSGEEAFQSLQKLGVKAILSVDGTQPDVELARKYGMRYVHIPIGYDGIDQQASLAMTRVAREIQWPLYVHCHHGRHRAPAAAAIVCLAAGTLSHEQSVALMKKSGTSPDYQGLWRDVAAFQSPAPGISLPELQEAAKVESMAAAMAMLDRHFDRVKLVAKAGWKVPDEHPDLVPVTEALLVREGLTEAGRHLHRDYPEAFRTLLKQSESDALELTNALTTGDPEKAGLAFSRLEKGCVKCHGEYRNGIRGH